jgi:hypothetical protein
VTQAEPDDDGRAAGPSGHTSTFEEIVASWVAEGTVPSWPDDPPELACPEFNPSPVAPPPAAPATPVVPPTPAAEEHFVPPEPPPLPRIGLTAAVALGLLGCGVVLLALPDLFGHGSSLGLPLGLFFLALGLAWLVLRCWQSEPPGNHDDDGAVL